MIPYHTQWVYIRIVHGPPTDAHHALQETNWSMMIFLCVLGKHHKHAQSMMITIFSSRFNIVGYEAHTFMTFSQIHHKLARYIVMFFHIHHRWINPLWRSIKFVMDEEPIVQSAWKCLLYFAYVAWIYHVGPTCQICTKIFFWLPKYNFMSSWWSIWHIGTRLAHMSA
jgi:hypothetical protein